jgi:hypothetical protein
LTERLKAGDFSEWDGAELFKHYAAEGQNWFSVRFCSVKAIG